MGSPLVLDTNVLSYIFNSHSIAEPYLQYIREKESAISFITLGEMLAGAEKRHWGEMRYSLLREFLGDYLLLNSNPEVADRYAWISAYLQGTGRVSSTNDIWIAATALAYDLTLLTHNRRHFESIPGLEVVSFAP